MNPEALPTSIGKGGMESKNRPTIEARYITISPYALSPVPGMGKADRLKQWPLRPYLTLHYGVFDLETQLSAQEVGAVAPGRSNENKLRCDL